MLSACSNDSEKQIFMDNIIDEAETVMITEDNKEMAADYIVENETDMLSKLVRMKYEYEEPVFIEPCKFKDMDYLLFVKEGKEYFTVSDVWFEYALLGGECQTYETGRSCYEQINANVSLSMEKDIFYKTETQGTDEEAETHSLTTITDAEDVMYIENEEDEDGHNHMRVYSIEDSSLIYESESIEYFPYTQQIVGNNLLIGFKNKGGNFKLDYFEVNMKTSECRYLFTNYEGIFSPDGEYFGYASEVKDSEGPKIVEKGYYIYNVETKETAFYLTRIRDIENDIWLEEDDLNRIVCWVSKEGLESLLNNSNNGFDNNLQERDMPVFVPSAVDVEINTFKHEKNGDTYTVNIEKDSSGCYTMHLYNNELNSLQSIPVEAAVLSIRGFGDINLDGYTDIVVYTGGTLNEMQKLFLFDPATQIFIPVLFEGIDDLSYFEVYDGYMMNWAKDSVDTVYVQKLIWKDNKLLLESEECIELE